MKWQEFSAEQRRIAVDATQLYQSYLNLQREYRELRGGLHWKTVGTREYLIKSLDRLGHQRSMGLRSPATEAMLREFTSGEPRLESRSIGGGRASQGAQSSASQPA